MNLLQRWRSLSISLFVRSALETVRTSLFLIPTVYVLGAVLVSIMLIYIDSTVRASSETALLSTTVSSAQNLLGTIAGAIITATSIVLSLAMVALQSSSSQFSPRLLRTQLRSRFQQHVMGFMVGTFTYCVIILKSIRASLTPNGKAFVPNYSVMVALILSVVAIVLILAYVDHVGRAMQVGQIIRSITDTTVAQIHRLGRVGNEGGAPGEMPQIPQANGHLVVSRDHGWIQAASPGAVMSALPAHCIVRFEWRVGEYVSPGQPLYTVWGPLKDCEQFDRAARRSVHLAKQRSIESDVDYGIRQLADVALRALSPSVNGPTTAFDVVVHLGTVIREVMRVRLPAPVLRYDNSRYFIRPKELRRPDYIRHAFLQIRHAGSTQYAIVSVLVETYGMLMQQARDEQLEDVQAVLVEEVQQLLEEYQRTNPLSADFVHIMSKVRESQLRTDNLSLQSLA